MRILRKFLIMSALVGVVFSAASCSGYRDIRIKSCRVESFSPNGLRSAEMNLAVSVDNPAGKLVVKYAHGVIQNHGRELGEIDLAPFEVPRKTDGARVSVDGEVRLSQSMTLLELMMMTRTFDPSGLTADVELKVWTAGVTKKLVFEDVPLAELVESLGAGGISNLLSL